MYRLLVISSLEEEEAVVSVLTGWYHGQRLTTCLISYSRQRRRAGTTKLFITT